MTQVIIHITLKNGVRDPDAKIAASVMKMLKIEGVNDVRVGRYFEIDLKEDLTEDVAMLYGGYICKETLPDTLTEDYWVSIEDAGQ